MINIRKGNQEDLPFILEMILELAKFEESLEQVNITLEQLTTDGFGENPVFYFFVAEKKGEIVGMAFCIIKYSTWKGKCLFLEDFYVKEKFRRTGIGQKLFKEIIKEAHKNKLGRIMWQVLDWNKPAIKFYKKMGAKISSNWLNGEINKEQIIEMYNK